MKTDARAGFTIVELLVVITIIGLVMALVLPAVQMAREGARRMSCTNNLKQIGLAIHIYHGMHDRLPPGKLTYGPWNRSQNWTSWPIAILPYIEQQPLYDLYNQKLKNDTPKNAKVCREAVCTYMCPTDRNADRVEKPESGPGRRLEYRGGSYRGMSGRCDGFDGWWDTNENEILPREWAGIFHVVGVSGLNCESMNTIKDGTSNTLMVGEYHTRTHTRRGTFWGYTHGPYNVSCASPDAHTLMPDFDECVAASGRDYSWQACKRAWGSFHPGGFNFLMCDGSVSFIEQVIDIGLFADLATIAGYEASQLPK